MRRRNGAGGSPGRSGQGLKINAGFGVEAEELEGLQLLEGNGEHALGAGLGAGEAFDAGFGALIEVRGGKQGGDGALEGVEGQFRRGDLADEEQFQFAFGGVTAGELSGARGGRINGWHMGSLCASSVDAARGARGEEGRELIEGTREIPAAGL